MRDARGRLTSSTDQPVGLADLQPGPSPDTNTDAHTDGDVDTVVSETVSPTEEKKTFTVDTSGLTVEVALDKRTNDFLTAGPLAPAGPPVWGPLLNRATSDGDAVPTTTPISPDGEHAGTGGSGIRIGRRGKRYDPAWPPASGRDIAGWLTDECKTVRIAWEWRGFRRSPSEKQWALLEGVNAAAPEALAALVEEAPAGLQSNEVIAFVLTRLNADPALRPLITAGSAASAQRTAERDAREATAAVHRRAARMPAEGVG